MRSSSPTPYREWELTFGGHRRGDFRIPLGTACGKSPRCHRIQPSVRPLPGAAAFLPWNITFAPLAKHRDQPVSCELSPISGGLVVLHPPSRITTSPAARLALAAPRFIHGRPNTRSTCRVPSNVNPRYREWLPSVKILCCGLKGPLMQTRPLFIATHPARRGYPLWLPSRIIPNGIGFTLVPPCRLLGPAATLRGGARITPSVPGQPPPPARRLARPRCAVCRTGARRRPPRSRSRTSSRRGWRRAHGATLTAVCGGGRTGGEEDAEPVDQRSPWRGYAGHVGLVEQRHERPGSGGEIPGHAARAGQVEVDERGRPPVPEHHVGRVDVVVAQRCRCGSGRAPGAARRRTRPGRRRPPPGGSAAGPASPLTSAKSGEHRQR